MDLSKLLADLQSQLEKIEEAILYLERRDKGRPRRRVRKLNVVGKHDRILTPDSLRKKSRCHNERTVAVLSTMKQ